MSLQACRSDQRLDVDGWRPAVLVGDVVDEMVIDCRSVPQAGQVTVSVIVMQVYQRAGGRPRMGETTGIWFGDDETLLSDFDEHFGEIDGADYSRSKRIKDAMALAMLVDSTIDSVDAELDIADRGARNAVAAAVRNEFAERE
jgi:hypothetical protein